MSGISRAFWLEGEGKAAIRTDGPGECAGGEVAVVSLYGAISRGTEALVAAGNVPPGEFERMRAPFQEGAFPFPVKYGYATVGTIVDGPASRLGRTVFCLYPHQDRFVVPVNMAIDVPQGTPPQRAVLGANMETALNAIWDSGLAAGDRIAIVGGGVLGLLTASIAAAVPGTRVTVVDINEARAPVARTLGCGFALPDGAKGDNDVVVHTSASEAGLVTALSLAGFEGRVVEASWYGGNAPRVPLGEAFHSRRLRLIASQVGHVSPERRPRWSRARRMAKALELLGDDRLDALFTGETAFDDLPSRYHAILADRATLCHRIVYPN